MTIYSVYLDFIQEKSLYCTKDTVSYYAGNIMRFLLSLGDYQTFPVNRLSRKEVDNYIGKLRQTSCKNVSVNTYLRAVRVFCSWLYQRGYLETNLACGMHFLKSDKANVVPIYQDEAARIDTTFDLSSKLGLRNYCIFHLMLDMGLRRNEVVSYSRDNLILEKGLMNVLGKGNKYRIVPVPKRLINYLMEYHEFGYAHFENQRGGKITHNTIKQLFQELKISSGINRIHPHLLRHTFATSYMIGGGNLEFLRILMGHTDYNVTRNYLHLASQFQLMGADIYKLDAIFFQKGY